MLGEVIVQVGYGEVEWVVDQAVDADAVHRGIETGGNGAVVAVVGSNRNVSEEGGSQRGKLGLAIQWRLGQGWHAREYTRLFVLRSEQKRSEKTGEQARESVGMRRRVSG